MTLSLVQRQPTWLVGAWGLKDNNVPREFAVCPIQPYEDAGQGGWATGTWKIFTGSVASGASTFTLIAADPNLTRLAIGTWILANSPAAGTAVVQGWLSRSVTAAGFENDLLVWQVSITFAAAGTVNIAAGDLLADRRIVVPPNYTYLAHLNTGIAAGDSYLVDGVELEAPAGYKIL